MHFFFLDFNRSAFEVCICTHTINWSFLSFLAALRSWRIFSTFMLFLTKGTHQQTCFCFGSITVYPMIFHFSTLQVFLYDLCPPSVFISLFPWVFLYSHICAFFVLVNLYLYLGEESPGSSCQSMGRLVFVLAPSKWVGGGGGGEGSEGGTLITNHLEQTTKDSNGKTNTKTHWHPWGNVGNNKRKQLVYVGK